MMKKPVLLAGLLLLPSAALAQSGTVTNHAFAVGKGPGVTGYTSVLCGNGQIAIGQTSADPICRTITGDVTFSSLGVSTLGNIPTGTTGAGSILFSNIAAPSTPAAGKVSIWTDTTDKRWHDKNDAGTIGTTVVADTGSANNFLTAISAAGAISKAQPSFANLSGNASVAQITTPLTTPPAIGGTTPAAGSFSSLTDTGVTGSTQCLQANTSGVISGTGGACAGASSVMLSGVVLAKTAAYPAVTGDCGDTITLGGSAQYTLTLNAASGYAANCGFMVTNLLSETSSKTIAINGLTSFYLWPGQTTIISNQSNTWSYINPGSWQLTGAVTFRVRPDGSDTLCDGLTNAAQSGASGQACAFQTPNHAMAVISDQIDINSQTGGSVTVNHTCASPPCTINNTTPTQFMKIVGVKFTGGVPLYSGDCTTPTNIKLIANAAQQAVIQSTFSDEINVCGFEMGGGANLQDGMYVSGGGTKVNITGPMQCDAMSANPGGGFASGNCFLANSQGNIYLLTSTMTWAGNVGSVFSATNGGLIENAVAMTLTASGTPACGSSCAYVVFGGLLNFPSLTNSGASTGSRFQVSFGGGITTGLGTCAVASTYFPGNSNGTISFAAGNVGSCF
jgi:hypothetical protein